MSMIDKFFGNKSADPAPRPIGQPAVQESTQEDEAGDTGSGKTWRMVGLGLAVVGMGVVAAAMFLSVQGLGVLFKLDTTLSTVTAGACVIAWMAHGLLAAF